MDNLIQDVQIEILSYLYPEDIITLYEVYQVMIDELSIHKGFEIHCTKLLNDDQIDWFRKKNIKLYLWKYNVINKESHKWYQNGKLHRDDDLPAVIYGIRQEWYQNGLRHRDNGLPAVICADGTKKWYQNNKIQEDRRIPTEKTFRCVAQLAIELDKPILLDYWRLSLERKVLIGVYDNKEKILVKSEEEYTSNIVKIYKSETEFIVITKNSIYIVSSDIPTKKVS